MRTLLSNAQGDIDVTNITTKGEMPSTSVPLPQLNMRWRILALLQLDCARKEDIVFQMNVLVQIPFELDERSEQGFVA
jgi:hypothetical protein